MKSGMLNSFVTCLYGIAVGLVTFTICDAIGIGALLSVGISLAAIFSVVYIIHKYKIDF